MPIYAGYQSPAVENSLNRTKALFDVNIFGVMAMTQEFTPFLVASNQRQPSGSEAARIVMIGSLAAVCPTPFYSAYNASKAALLQYSNTLRIELEPFGIRVITVSTEAVCAESCCLPELRRLTVEG